MTNLDPKSQLMLEEMQRHCAETIITIISIQRHGFEKIHDGRTLAQHLEFNLGNLRGTTKFLSDNGELSPDAILKFAARMLYEFGRRFKRKKYNTNKTSDDSESNLDSESD